MLSIVAPSSANTGIVVTLPGDLWRDGPLITAIAQQQQFSHESSNPKLPDSCRPGTFFLVGRKAKQGLLADQIHTILAERSLTLHQISQMSSARFGRHSPHFIPHNLYYDLKRKTFTPSVYQMFAFSALTGYQLSDWFRVFGVELEDVPRIQTTMPRKRTILLDASLTHAQGWICGLDNRENLSALPSIAPLAQLVKRDGPVRIGSFAGANCNQFLFALIGHEDTVCFPNLLPSSVVRIDPRHGVQSLPTKQEGVSERIFLLKHSKGLFCSRVRRVTQNVISPVSEELSFGQTELSLGSQTKILGAVDLEIRPLLTSTSPNVGDDLARHWSPQPLRTARSVSELLRWARCDANLSFREATAMTRIFSDMLGDRRFRISPSSLCDYEIQAPTGSPHKIAALCFVYGLRLDDLLTAMGLPIGESGHTPIPDSLVGRSTPIACREQSVRLAIEGNGFASELTRQIGPLPFFLRESFANYVGIRNASIQDVFWIGGEQDTMHPDFKSALLAAVNHRKKRPHYFPSEPIWAQPVYLLLKRDGSYICACCSVENGVLVVHPHTERFFRDVIFQNRKEIEVVGQITAIARRLP